jgi:hypothetical protein
MHERAQLPRPRFEQRDDAKHVRATVRRVERALAERLPHRLRRRNVDAPLVALVPVVMLRRRRVYSLLLQVRNLFKSCSSV